MLCFISIWSQYVYTKCNVLLITLFINSKIIFGWLLPNIKFIIPKYLLLKSDSTLIIQTRPIQSATFVYDRLWFFTLFSKIVLGFLFNHLLCVFSLFVCLFGLHSYNYKYLCSLWLQTCVICKQSHGSCTSCVKCATYFHVMCASRAGYTMEVSLMLLLSVGWLIWYSFWFSWFISPS